jgi:hypothetical protein
MYFLPLTKRGEVVFSVKTAHYLSGHSVGPAKTSRKIKSPDGLTEVTIELWRGSFPSTPSVQSKKKTILAQCDVLVFYYV